MNQKRYRTHQVNFRVTDEEYRALKKKATRNGMTVSKYIREAVIHSNERLAPTIDVSMLKSIDHELKKQGTNLNQLMRFLNTYGIGGYDTKMVQQVLGLKGEAYLKLSNILGDLRTEAEKHHVHILDSGDDDGDWLAEKPVDEEPS